LQGFGVIQRKFNFVEFTEHSSISLDIRADVNSSGEHRLRASDVTLSMPGTPTRQIDPSGGSIVQLHPTARKTKGRFYGNQWKLKRRPENGLK